MSAFADLSPWAHVPTPFIAIDTTTLDANLRRVQALCDQRGLSLRPHAKTHKLREIAASQLAGGAQGLTVASLGEAEAFAEAGFDDLFIAYSLPGTEAVMRRLRALSEVTRLRIAVDGIDGLESLGRLGLSGISAVSVVIEVDSGLRRTGVAPADSGILAQRACELGFEVAGIFTYPGHGYGVEQQRSAAEDERRSITAARAALAKFGLACEVRSGGSTPTLLHSSAEALTEIRPGVYPLNDAQQVALGTAELGQVAAVAVATVISTPEAGRLVLDAGSKTIASDRPPYVDGHGLVLGWAGTTVSRIWEHHAVVDMPGDLSGRRPRVGDRVAVVPNHICTAMNLADRVEAFDGDEVQTWRLEARGRNA